MTDPIKEVHGDLRVTGNLILGGSIQSDTSIAAQGPHPEAAFSGSLTGLDFARVGLGDNNVPPDGWVNLTLGAPGQANVGGSLQVARDLVVGGRIIANIGPVAPAAVSSGSLTGLDFARVGLGSNDVPPDGWVNLTLLAPGQAQVGGSLKVTQDLVVDGTVTGNIADGTVQAGDLADNAVGTNAIADGAITGLKLAGNSVDATKIIDGSIGENKLTTAAVSTSKLADAAVTGPKLAPNSVDGTKIIDGSIGPNELATAAVSTLKIADAAVTGAKLAANSVDGTKIVDGSIGSNELAAGAVTAIKLADHSVTVDKVDFTPAQIGAIPASGGTVNGTLTVTTPNNESAGFWVWVPDYKVTPLGAMALLSALVLNEDTYGIYVRSTINSETNHFEGATTFTGPVVFRGSVDFQGGKPGYVVDRFINADKSALRTGDVVKLRGRPVARFEGQLNRLPVSEVVLADKDDDPAVIGIVHLEAPSNRREPDFHAAPRNPAVIPQGGELHVVTLGAFAHCKVDASEVPIEVGDLLTTSSKPGFAKKAIHSKPGSIIGKAMEPLKEGTGYISVFVNLQ